MLSTRIESAKVATIAACCVFAFSQFASAQSCSSCSLMGGSAEGCQTVEIQGSPNAGMNIPPNTGNWPGTGNYQFSDGNTAVYCPKGVCSYQNPAYRAWLAGHDRFSPYPWYAYSRHGIDAARMHEWNKFRAQQTQWHGGHNYWRFNRPTALVVPPTAAFQTSYAWGVGQTRSMPINHQFGAMAPGGGAGSSAFSSAPYWPSSTDQFGVHPVRAPWSHLW